MARFARFATRDRTVDGAPCPPSDVDDWSSMIGEFASGATGVWEGTTLAKGYHRDGFGHEWAEVNGSEGSAVYRLHEPNTILLGKTGQDLAPVPVPPEFLKPPGSPRDPAQGAPGDRIPIRPDVGIHLGDRRTAPRRAQLL